MSGELNGCVQHDHAAGTGRTPLAPLTKILVSALAWIRAAEYIFRAYMNAITLA
jgi:hypothetical protein